jgi:uncharacterized protein YggT (Ycf19 family)
MPFNPLRLNLLHTLVNLVLLSMIVCLLIQVVLSWLTLMFVPPNHPIVRFFTRATAPVLDPLRRRIPTMSLGMLDLSTTIAFIFAWWALVALDALLQYALPAGW